MPPPLLATPPAGPAGGGDHAHRLTVGGPKALDTPLPPEAVTLLPFGVGPANRTLRLYARKSRKLIF